nr:class I SAM-dependent methyltransferase [Actinomycetota bacterium]
MPHPSLVRRHKGLLRHSLHQLLHVDAVRHVVATARYRWYVTVRRRLRTLEGSAAVSGDTVHHNVSGMGDLAVVRSLFLIRPLSVVEQLGPDADVLSIGPRTEGELLALLAHGFDRRHLRAVDLISYSPWVDLGDMHSLPYADDSFDAVVAGWVLAYSDDKQRAASEIVRVARPGATVAVGIEWNPDTNEAIEAAFGYLPGSEERLTSTAAILALFAGSVDRVLVEHDIAAPTPDEPRALVVLF